MSDQAHMRAALALARRGLGNAWPNPSVGCVIVRDGRVVGRAVTAPGGRPHAEPLALAMAGAAARGATAYVTLEPCCHHGRTPPCTDALIAAGVARVVIASRDVDPRVNGAGAARLRAAGIVVEEGVLADEADDVNAGFFASVRRGRPLVTLKLASTLDGRIATRTGESKWITGEAGRRAAHALRGRHDAVMVGVGTVLTDDPDLTCRIPGYKSVPTVRVVADSHLRTKLTARLVVDARKAPTWIVARNGADPLRRRALAELGVTLVDVPGSESGVDLKRALEALAQRGITRLLVEGGGQMAASLLRADLVDRIAWFHAPAVMGGDGWPSAQAFGISRLADMPRFVRHAAGPVGVDWLTELRRAA
ncbi:bifunctional diaminohydroxyphosphoribosylaminopyrimidine deaminase/5-amino-6-(5-phosphoribosylamino)uracil reductase RibD [Limobrevibacterium gyesilva]|uniref:Riboflavin biosynthesis protein RibD n=1 Tax=Limobrevibacterium gyesilva TaxID=2991712 RepID=A0AA42CDJ6_9PROT|nr:bifunctional diaminohydroxyphosphoribosylaminopyrimidine deaminase/5-amino-6-(5-phosphoribosylamino)uracil reductase RibD [Limobrevibacterium gyesilva]MCW3473959.1 bifunctional diaminohydroxyphosphoribosylaminopyrimidine deaminase/5-amino-6-(5-phosphoribosylamino)uracil reductase RibD [Limobrevibacterium gyesilva]